MQLPKKHKRKTAENTMCYEAITDRFQEAFARSLHEASEGRALSAAKHIGRMLKSSGHAKRAATHAAVGAGIGAGIGAAHNALRGGGIVKGAAKGGVAGGVVGAGVGAGRHELSKRHMTGKPLTPGRTGPGKPEGPPVKKRGLRGNSRPKPWDNR